MEALVFENTNLLRFFKQQLFHCENKYGKGGVESEFALAFVKRDFLKQTRKRNHDDPAMVIKEMLFWFDCREYAFRLG